MNYQIIKNNFPSFPPPPHPFLCQKLSQNLIYFVDQQEASKSQHVENKPPPRAPIREYLSFHFLYMP